MHVTTALSSPGGIVFRWFSRHLFIYLYIENFASIYKINQKYKGKSCLAGRCWSWAVSRKKRVGDRLAELSIGPAIRRRKRGRRGESRREGGSRCTAHFSPNGIMLLFQLLLPEVCRRWLVKWIWWSSFQYRLPETGCRPHHVPAADQ